RAYVCVRRRSKFIGTPAPHVGFGFKLDMCLQPDDGFVIHTSLSRLLDELVRLNEQVRREPQALMEPANHLETEGALTAKDLLYLASTPDERLQVPFRQASTFQVIANGIDGVSLGNRKLLLFVSRDERRQDFQAIALRRIPFRVE